MDEILQFFRQQGGQGEQLTRWETLFALGLSTLCLLTVCLIYRFTHRGTRYSQSYVQTLVLTGLVTTLIMIVIGSNIARAFSLVGALSIIRFRNAVKETRDVGYIFFAMAIAMACGTRFYFLAIMATGLIGSIMILLHFIDFGTNRIRPERMLMVQLPPNTDPETSLQATFDEMFETHALVLVESVRQGTCVEAVFSVRPKPGVTASTVLEAVARVNANLKVTYNYASHTDEL